MINIKKSFRNYITNKGVLHIPQSLSITGASPSDCFGGDFNLLQRHSRYILQPQPSGLWIWYKISWVNTSQNIDGIAFAW